MCNTRDHTRIVVDSISATYLFVLYVVYMALGTTMGVGEICRANIGLCFFDHFMTLYALVIVGSMAYNVVLMVRLPRVQNSLKLLRLRITPVPKPRSVPTPQPQAPAPTPLEPASQPEPEQQQNTNEQDKESVVSSATTLQGECLQNGKDKEKRHSVIAIYSIEEHGPFSLTEYTVIPNPTSGNPGSEPNKGL
jgi:hypothetical protein